MNPIEPNSYSTFYFARRLRTHQKNVIYYIGIFSITLGIATSLCAISILQGFQKDIEHKLVDFSGHIKLVKYTTHLDNNYPPIDYKQLDDLKHGCAKYIHDIRGSAHKPVLLRTPDGTAMEGVLCKGIKWQSYSIYLSQYLKAGSLPKSTMEILISTTIAKRLQVGPGSALIMCALEQPPRYRKITISGVYASHIDMIDDQLAFCDLRLIQQLNQWPENFVDHGEIFLKPGHQLSDNQPPGHQLHKTIDTLLDHLSYDILLEPTQQTYAAIFDWLKVLKKNATIFIIFILIAIITNLISIVLISVMERTSMIGVLRALGASTQYLRKVFFWYHFQLIWKGIVWGNILGCGICALQYYTHMLHLTPDVYYIDHVPISWQWLQVICLNLMIIGLALSVLFITTTWTMRMQTINAINYR